jgi:hypothetical protein
MPQINISLSDEIHDYLVQIASLTGITKSSLAAEYVRRGLYEDARNHKELLQLQMQKELQEQKQNPLAVAIAPKSSGLIATTATTATAEEKKLPKGGMRNGRK